MGNVVPGPPYPGIYEHYKGGMYVVHKIIFDSSNKADGAIMVLYESLDHQSLTVRKIVEFTENVHPNGMASGNYHLPGSICGYCRPRFKWINEIENYGSH